MMPPKIAVSLPNSVPPRGAYSRAVVVGDVLYSAGIGPRDVVTGSLPGPSIEAQVQQTLANLRQVVEAGGYRLDDVVKVTVYLHDIERDFGAFDRLYRQWWQSPYPARTTVGAVLPGILIEMDAVAVRGAGSHAEEGGADGED